MDHHKILERQKETVSGLLRLYDGKEPLHLYLKKHFAANKQFGSKDRKIITGLCYSYFRLGQNVTRLQQADLKYTMTKIVGMAGYITGLLPDVEATPAVPESPAPEPATSHSRFIALSKRLNDAVTSTPLDTKALFPFTASTSNGLDLEQFRLSMLEQPKLFIRIRPGSGIYERVTQGLHQHKIPFEEIKAYRSDETSVKPPALALPPGTPLDNFFQVNKDLVIQDISSQQMAIFMERILEAYKKNTSDQRPKKLKIWDACAASGGKSILALDVFEPAGLQTDITVSDIRSSILNNLDNRFKKAGTKGYKKLILNLLQDAPLPFTNSFDLVICDAPCTGSGTWARSPENLLYFDERSIESFYDRQTRIAAKALKMVAKGGYFLYMTCSIFARENEQVAEFIASINGMNLVHSTLITGYEQKGDTMYGALFCRAK